MPYLYYTTGNMRSRIGKTIIVKLIRNIYGAINIILQYTSIDDRLSLANVYFDCVASIARYNEHIFLCLLSFHSVVGVPRRLLLTAFVLSSVVDLFV